MLKNTEYLREKGCPEEAIQACLDVMKKYGDNCWWFSEDSDDIAYFQLNEPVMITKMHDFHEALEKLLGRPVQTIEFAINTKGLKQEAEMARKSKNVGKIIDIDEETISTLFENEYVTFYIDYNNNIKMSSIIPQEDLSNDQTIDTMYQMAEEILRLKKREK